ncbi:MAG: DUF2889 domain-containing protein [Desulfitobacterium sp.]
MKNLFRRNWYTEVCHSGTNLLKAKTSYIDSFQEIIAHLVVDVNSFKIKEAYLEKLRSFESINVITQQVEPLIDKEINYGFSSALKEATEFLENPLATTLFAETIKGIIQAQNFLFEECGYASLEEYDTHRCRELACSCRYFSTLDRITQCWYEKIGNKRRNTVFMRFKTQSLFALKKGQYFLTGNLRDSLHEVNASIRIGDFLVEEATGELLRSPDPVCREAAEFMGNLKGVNLKGKTKKEIALLLGKGQGCVHLIDLVDDCTHIFEIFNQNPLTYEAGQSSSGEA